MTLVDADRPREVPFDRDQAFELATSAIAAAVGVWVAFTLAGAWAPFGFIVCWFAAATAIYGVVVRQRHGSVELKDRLATVFIIGGTLLALLPLVLVIYFTLRKGLPVVFTKFPKFIGQDLHRFGVNDKLSRGTSGLQASIIGTVEQVGMATLVTVPVGVLAATYLNEVGGRFAMVVRTVADAMTGLPSVIAGLFIYSFWILPRRTGGYSGFAAAMALSVVMLPTVIRTAEEVLRIVSDSYREAALALGAPEWRMVLRVVIPTARTGLVTAALLGIARAAGETAPVYLTAFGSTHTNWNPFRGGQDDLPYRVYAFARQPSANLIAVAWGGATLLIVIVLTLFVLARILGTGAGRGRGNG